MKNYDVKKCSATCRSVLIKLYFGEKPVVEVNSKLDKELKKVLKNQYKYKNIIFKDSTFLNNIFGNSKLMKERVHKTSTPNYRCFQRNLKIKKVGSSFKVYLRYDLKLNHGDRAFLKSNWLFENFNFKIESFLPELFLITPSIKKENSPKISFFAMNHDEKSIFISKNTLLFTFTLEKEKVVSPAIFENKIEETNFSISENKVEKVDSLQEEKLVEEKVNKSLNFWQKILNLLKSLLTNLKKNFTSNLNLWKPKSKITNLIGKNKILTFFQIQNQYQILKT